MSFEIDRLGFFAEFPRDVLCIFVSIVTPAWALFIQSRFEDLQQDGFDFIESVCVRSAALAFGRLLVG